MSETIIAFKCNDFVIMAGAGLNAFYYIKITEKEDKITQLDSHKLVACAGENGPRTNFVEYIKCNMALNTVRQHGRQSSTPAAAAFMRNALAGALRSRDGLYECNSLLGGFDAPASEHDDTPSGAHLYYLDYLGTMQSVPFAAHGYGTTFVTAILDELWRPDLSEQEGLDLMQKCCNEVKKRVVVSNNYFICKVITTKGVEVVTTVS
jgi:20S proteasome subunit beta 4